MSCVGRTLPGDRYETRFRLSGDLLGRRACNGRGRRAPTDRRSRVNCALIVACVQKHTGKGVLESGCLRELVWWRLGGGVSGGEAAPPKRSGTSRRQGSGEGNVAETGKENTSPGGGSGSRGRKVELSCRLGRNTFATGWDEKRTVMTERRRPTACAPV